VNGAGLDENKVVEVLGVFSLTPLTAADPTGYIEKYDIKLLDGRYYIIHRHLRDSYKDLRKALENFLQKSGTIDGNIYAGITIYNET